MSNDCLNCGTTLDFRDEDLNGEKSPICAQCRAEEAHDFDAEPDAKFNRRGHRYN